MKVGVKTQTNSRSGAAQDRTNGQQLVLRRKCACEGSSTSHGECEKCRKKRLRLKPPFIQTKLTINEPGDEYEREADRVAEQVMRMADPTRQRGKGVAQISHEPSSQGKREKDDQIFRQDESHGQGIGVAEPSLSALSIVQNVLSSPGQPLDAGTRTFMEPRFGHDFSRVRVHTDAQASSSALAVNALAYTVGSDIVFAPHQYAPNSAAGQKLLGHELVHVVQQGSSTASPVALTDSPLPKGSQWKREDSAEVTPGTENPEITKNTTSIIQRSVGSPAGGCGVCYGNPRDVGTVAHSLIEAAFELQYGNTILTEFPLLLLPSAGDENGRLDLATPIADGFAIGEIKPANPAGLLQGDLDLFWYEDEIHKYGLRTQRMILPPPLLPIKFPNPVPPTCPPQMLYVDAPVQGIYTYFCEPDFKVLRSNPGCRCLEEEKREEKKQQVATTSRTTSGETAVAAPGRGGRTGMTEVITEEEALPQRVAPAAKVPPVPKFSHDSWTTLDRINGMFEYIVNAPRENSLEVIFDWTSDVRSFLIDFISGYSHALKRTFGIGGSLGSEELDEISRMLNNIDRDAKRFYETGASELLQRIVNEMIRVIQYIHEQTEWELTEDLLRGGPYIAAGLVVIALTAYLAAPLVVGAGAGTAATTATTATSTGVPLTVISGGGAAAQVTIGGSVIPAAAVTTTRIAAGFAGAVVVGSESTR